MVLSDHYGMPGMPNELKVIISFEEAGKKTKMTLRHVGMPEFMGKDASVGWNESFDKLAECLKGMK